MKTRAIIAVVIIAVVVGIWLWLQFAVQPTHSVTQLTQPPTAGPKASASTPERITLPPEKPYEPSDARWLEVHRKDKVDPGWEWKAPINFYGRVVDGGMLPIAAAKVTFSWTNISAAGSSQAKTVSDANGFFSLEGKAGRLLEVDVSKEGYYQPSDERLRSFDYSAFWETNYHRPSREDPVLFHLQKKGEAESLIYKKLTVELPANGTPMRLDLLKGGALLSSGQLEMAAVTNTDRYPPRIYDWRASIAVVDGGLLEHHDEFAFTAPEVGYQSKVEFEMPMTSPDWKSVLNKSYYFRVGSPPRYGRIEIELHGYSPKTYISFWLNPSGSRNLEYDPSKQAAAR